MSITTAVCFCVFSFKRQLKGFLSAQLLVQLYYVEILGISLFFFFAKACHGSAASVAAPMLASLAVALQAPTLHPPLSLSSSAVCKLAAAALVMES